MLHNIIKTKFLLRTTLALVIFNMFIHGSIDNKEQFILIFFLLNFDTQ
jgi:hypothetical protein